MTLFVKCSLGFSSRLGGISRFAFTFAYTRSFWPLEGVSTVKIFSSENQVRLILFWVICFFKRLQAFNRFSLSAAVRDWTSRHRNTLSCKSFLAILTTDERESPVSITISRGLLLVPACPSWLQMKSLTNWMFESVLAKWGRPLPGSLSTLPVESIFFTRSYNARRFHCLSENSDIILSTVQPFSVRKTLINKRFSAVKGAILIAYTHVMSLLTCSHFRPISKEYLLTRQIFLIAQLTAQSFLHILT